MSTFDRIESALGISPLPEGSGRMYSDVEEVRIFRLRHQIYRECIDVLEALDFSPYDDPDLLSNALAHMSAVACPYDARGFRIIHAIASIFDEREEEDWLPSCLIELRDKLPK